MRENQGSKLLRELIVENEESMEFLKNLGLEEPDNIAEIKEFIIPKYQGSYIEKNEYIDDFKRVLDIWLKCDKYQKPEVADLLKQSQFIRCINQSQAISYQKPNDVYFCEDELLTWYKGNLSDNIYFLKVGIQLTEDSSKSKFLKSLGVRDNLKMSGINDIGVHDYGRYERSVNGFNPYFDIDGLGFSLENITIEKSIFLWSILLKHTNKLKGYIATKTNQMHPYNKGMEKTSKAMYALRKSKWLYDKDGNLIDLPIDEVELDDLNDGYDKEDDNSEKLVKALGLKLDIVTKFEEETGLKAVDGEKFEEFEKWKKAQSDNSSENNEYDWSPDVNPEEASISIDESDFPDYSQNDLSNQNIKENAKTDDTVNNAKQERESIENLNKTRNSKAIGDWGERFANKHLVKKYPKNEVVWLNKNGNTGKGYDFVIRDNDEDIAYYEVKSKIDEAPQLFQISGTQWGWARKLYNSKKGEMYRILLISNAGKKDLKIKEIVNPIELWNAGELCADPVQIML